MKKTLLLLPLLCISLSGCDLEPIKDTVMDVMNSLNKKELSDEEFDAEVKNFDDTTDPNPKQYKCSVNSLSKIDDKVYNQSIINTEYIRGQYAHSYTKYSGLYYKYSDSGEEGESREMWYFINNGYISAMATISSKKQEKYYEKISAGDFYNIFSDATGLISTYKPSYILNSFPQKENIKHRGNKSGYLDFEFSYKSTVYADNKSFVFSGKVTASYKRYRISRIEMSGIGESDGAKMISSTIINASYNWISAKKPNLNGFEKK